MARFAPAALLVTAALVIGAAPARATTVPGLRGVTVGIADQKIDMFSDRRFARLAIQDARLAIAWNALTVPHEAAELDAWLAWAQAKRITPLISLMHAREGSSATPTPARLGREFRRLRERYPWVTTYATWNEANHCGEPLCERPRLAAGYYRALRRICPRCTILAPELLDGPNMVSWAKQFSAELGFAPALWGVHNYIEANRFRMQRLRELLSALPDARIWLTETGGLVRRDNHSATKLPAGVSHAAETTRYIFDHVLPRNPRIRRVYLYHWNAGPPTASWDSGLVAADGQPRGALLVLRRVLGEGARPETIFAAPRASPDRPPAGAASPRARGPRVG